jgi:hypothetical protein
MHRTLLGVIPGLAPLPHKLSCSLSEQTTPPSSHIVMREKGILGIPPHKVNFAPEIISTTFLNS